MQGPTLVALRRRARSLATQWLAAEAFPPASTCGVIQKFDLCSSMFVQVPTLVLVVSGDVLLDGRGRESHAEVWRCYASSC